MSKKRRTLSDFEDEAIAGLSLPEPPAPEPDPAPVPDEPVPVPPAAGARETGRPASPPTATAGEWHRFSLRLTTEQFADARGAFIADVDNVPSSAETFREWIDRAVSVHAHRTVEQRARLAAALPKDAGRTRTCSVQVLASTLVTVDQAVAVERRAGRPLSRNAIIREALLVATETARKRNGGRIQPITTRLPGRVMTG